MKTTTNKKDKRQYVNLDHFLGKHKLSGIDFENIKVETYEKSGYHDDALQCNFRIDGITYTAIEDPSDGYRSALKEIFVSDVKPKTVFKPVNVVGKMKDKGYYDNDTVQFIDVENGKVVLEIGTDNSDDYYPSFVARWTPENLHLNDKKQKG